MDGGAKPVPRSSLPTAPNQLFRPDSMDGGGSGGSHGSGGGFSSTSYRGRNHDEPATITLIKSIKGLADFGLGTLDSLATEPLRSPRSRNRTTAEGQRKAVMPLGAPPRFPWIARRRARARRRGSDTPPQGEARSRGVIEADITPILHTNAFSSFVHKVRGLPNRSSNKKAAAAASRSTSADVDPWAGAAAATRPAETAVIPAARERKAITNGVPNHAAEAARTSVDRLDKPADAGDGRRGGFWRESSRDRHRRPGATAEEGSGALASALVTASNGRLTALMSEDGPGNHRWGSSSNLTAEMASERSTAEGSERGFLGRLYSKLGVSLDRTPDGGGSDVELSEDEHESDDDSEMQAGKAGPEGERMARARLGPAPSLYHVCLVCSSGVGALCAAGVVRCTGCAAHRAEWACHAHSVRLCVFSYPCRPLTFDIIAAGSARVRVYYLFVLCLPLASPQDDFISFQTKASKAGPGAAKKASKGGGRILPIRP